jgi:hypothetical protein
MSDAETTVLAESQICGGNMTRWYQQKLNLHPTAGLVDLFRMTPCDQTLHERHLVGWIPNAPADYIMLTVVDSMHQRLQSDYAQLVVYLTLH